MVGHSIIQFVILIVIFVFRIVWLVFRSNFYWIILGWDGLGVVSFYLIIYYNNQVSVVNGIFTLFQNRLGDLFFLIFIFLIFDFYINVVQVSFFIFLILGALVKSAQFPFNSWLLAAIRAPTPISSLVHSSTLVVAGVYVIIQYRYCLRELKVLILIRVISLIIRMIGLILEVDYKKLIAFSTINHVSLMLFLIRIGIVKIAYFHLNVHAIFKSLIFICFGYVILYSYHNQDARLVGLFNLIPQLKIIFYFACLRLLGFPFLRGFFSKDFIIEIIFFNVNYWYFFVLVLNLGLRLFYVCKLFSLAKIERISYEMNMSRVWRIGLSLFLSLALINILIRVVFTIKFEVDQVKFLVYYIMLLWIGLNFFNLTIKLSWRYNLTDLFSRFWVVNYYYLDVFFITVVLNKFYWVKSFLVLNWWILLLFVILVYNLSLKCDFEEVKIFLYFFWC